MSIGESTGGANELLTNRQFSVMLAESLGGIRNEFGDIIDVYDFVAEFPRVEISTEPLGTAILPATLDDTGEVVTFNMSQFRRLAQLSSPIGDGKDIERLSRLYVGTSVGYKILNDTILPHQSTKIDRVYTVLANISSLHTAIMCSDIPEIERMELLKDIMQSEEARVAHIGALRFATGLLFAGEKNRENEQFALNLQKSFMIRLVDMVAKKTEYTQFFQNLTGDSRRANRMFLRHARGLSLAVAYPMSNHEVCTILDICKSNGPQSIESFLAGIFGEIAIDIVPTDEIAELGNKLDE